MKNTITLAFVLLAIGVSQVFSLTDRRVCQDSDPTGDQCESFDLQNFKTTTHFKHNSTSYQGLTYLNVQAFTALSLCKSCITLEMSIFGYGKTVGIDYSSTIVPNGTGFQYYLLANFSNSIVPTLGCANTSLSNGYTSYACDAVLNFTTSAINFTVYQIKLMILIPQEATAVNQAYSFTNDTFGSCLEWTNLCWPYTDGLPAAIGNKFTLCSDSTCNSPRTNNFFSASESYMYVSIPMDNIPMLSMTASPFMVLATTMLGYNGTLITNLTTSLENNNLIYRISLKNMTGYSSVVTVIATISYQTTDQVTRNYTKMVNVPIIIEYVYDNSLCIVCNGVNNGTNGTSVATSGMGTGTILAIVLPLVAVLSIAIGVFAWCRCKPKTMNDPKTVTVNGSGPQGFAKDEMDIVRSGSNVGSDLESAASEKPNLNAIDRPVAPPKRAC